MASAIIHLAVAKKYLENHASENKEDFILGTIAPDINMSNIGEYINGVTEDKNSYHFGLNYQTENIIEYMKKKVDFSLFFQSNDINTSFLRGYFLHLLCDHTFYDENINNEKLNSLSYEEALKVGYNDYDLITGKIVSKYNLEIPESLKDIFSRKGTGKLEILNEDKVYEFIDRMINVNLEEEKERVLKN